MKGLRQNIEQVERKRVRSLQVDSPMQKKKIERCVSTFRKEVMRVKIQSDKIQKLNRINQLKDQIKQIIEKNQYQFECPINEEYKIFIKHCHESLEKIGYECQLKDLTNIPKEGMDFLLEICSKI